MATTIRRALRKLGASDRERARGLLHHPIGVASQIGEHRVGFRLPDAARERGRGQRDEGFQIGNSCPQARVRLPQAFAFDRLRIGCGKAAGAERQRPALIVRQIGKALHRGSIDTLAYHLIEREHAALARPLGIGERDRRRCELGSVRPMSVAGEAVAGRAALDV
mgnify:CR=1 FL=1